MVLFLLEYIVAEAASQDVNTLLGKVALLPFGIDHQVDMRMVSGVVKGSVPLEVTDRDFVSFCDGGDISSDQGFPGFCVVVAQPLRILPVETHDVRPDIALVVTDFFGCNIQIDGIIRLRKKSMFP